MGVICRYQDKENFIYGSVGTDGYYAIIEIKEDEATILTGSGKFQKSDAIPVGSETYVIRLACEGSYTFVNGEKIDSANSSAPPAAMACWGHVRSGVEISTTL
jgi:hypothetical protein